MESMLVNRRDTAFVLYELLDVETLVQRSRFTEHSRETFDATLDLAHRIATEQFAPHNRKADANEPRFDNGRVRMIPEVGQALDAFCAAGLMACAHDEALGGMQLPYTVAQAAFALFDAANIATAAYPFLTMANANLIEAFGSPEQRARFLPHLLSGRYFGTMCLSEPQAGSSLADIRTTAIPQADGSYRIVGNKMWISGGEHDLSENIIHLVLARVQGAPAGVKGLSLFIVPKSLMSADGSPREPNDVVLAGLNHKMGYRGTTNCVLNFGERGGAHAELIGPLHQGLACMFHMMNEARIGVGLGATMLGYTGYLHAFAYARGRPQGRPVAGKDPHAPQVPIVRHADVKRMLLAQKAYVEGAYALCLTAARLVDEQKTAPEASARQEASLLLDVLTPIVKSWPSQWCLEANALAIQVHGGYGYTREYPVEQFYRDNRLNPIHEGTHGIQALDLLSRKVVMQDGAALRLLMRTMRLTVAQARDIADRSLQDWGMALDHAVTRAEATTAALVAARDSAGIEIAVANAAVYLEMMGHVVVAWIWLRQAIVAHAGLTHADAEDAAFYRGKLQAAAYFFGWELPRMRAQCDLLERLDTTCVDMHDEWF